MAALLDAVRELGLLDALVEGVRAPRPELAALRQVDQRRRRALDRVPAAPASAGRAAGSSPAGPTCTGAAGRRRAGASSARSTTRPAYMTAISSAISATTPRSCVIRITAELNSSLEPVDQLDDLGLDRDVERGRRLVGDQHVRVARERHRDHRALAHPARELVRVVVDALAAGSGCRPARSSSTARRSRLLLGRPLVRRGSPRRSGRRPCRPGSATSSGPGRSSRSRCRGPRSSALAHRQQVARPCR